MSNELGLILVIISMAVTFGIVLKDEMAASTTSGPLRSPQLRLDDHDARLDAMDEKWEAMLELAAADKKHDDVALELLQLHDTKLRALQHDVGKQCACYSPGGKINLGVPLDSSVKELIADPKIGR